MYRKRDGAFAPSCNTSQQTAQSCLSLSLAQALLTRYGPMKSLPPDWVPCCYSVLLSAQCPEMLILGVFIPHCHSSFCAICLPEVQWDLRGGRHAAALEICCKRPLKKHDKCCLLLIVGTRIIDLWLFESHESFGEF